MSVLATMVLVERYGLRLNVDQLAEVLDVQPGTVRNQISAERFPIPTYLDQGRRWADARDVAAYLDACRDRARSGAGTPA